MPCLHKRFSSVRIALTDVLQGKIEKIFQGGMVLRASLGYHVCSVDPSPFLGNCLIILVSTVNRKA